MVIWWLGIPAMAFVAYQAFRRRSLRPRADPDRVPVPVGLLGADRPGLVPVPLLHEPAVRGPRARLLRRPSSGTGRRAGRGCSPGPSAAVALMGPVILWLAAPAAVRDRGRGVGQRGLAGVQRQPGQPRGDAAPRPRWSSWRSSRCWCWSGCSPASPGRAATDGRWADATCCRSPLTAVVGGVAARAHPAPARRPSRCSRSTASCPSSSRSLVAIPLALVAIQVLTARDAHRFVLGFVAAAAALVRVPVPQHRGAAAARRRSSTRTRGCCRPTCTRSSSP